MTRALLISVSRAADARGSAIGKGCGLQLCTFTQGSLKRDEDPGLTHCCQNLFAAMPRTTSRPASSTPHLLMHAHALLCLSRVGRGPADTAELSGS